MRGDVIHSLTLGRLGHDVTRDLSDCRTIPNVATSAACVAVRPAPGQSFSPAITSTFAAVEQRQADVRAFQRMAGPGGWLLERPGVNRGR